MYDYYKAHDYAFMISDTTRVGSYAEALRRSVTPSSRVLDIGCGSGVFSLLASRLGARKVVAVEPNAIIDIARSLAEANGVADRIEFFRGMTTDLDLSQRFDVIVSDLRGTTPLHGKHLRSIIDARERLLKPGGILIPRADRLMVAGVGDPELHRGYVEPWQDSFGLELTPLKKVLGEEPLKKNLEAEQVNLGGKSWALLDYTQVESVGARGAVEWDVPAVTRLFGLVIWFDSTLMEGIEYSNAPGLESMVYGHLFLPILEPVDLRAGDRLRVEISAAPYKGIYRWRWRGLLSREGGRAGCVFEV